MYLLHSSILTTFFVFKSKSHLWKRNATLQSIKIIVMQLIIRFLEHGKSRFYGWHFVVMFFKHDQVSLSVQNYKWHWFIDDTLYKPTLSRKKEHLSLCPRDGPTHSSWIWFQLSRFFIIIILYLTTCFWREETYINLRK